MTRKDEIETVAMLAMAMHSAVVSGRAAVGSHPRFRQAFQDAAELLRQAKRCATHAENECSREVSSREAKADRNREIAIGLLASWYGFRAEFSGDPRGFVVKLYGTGLPSNDLSGDGAFGVA